MMTRVCSRLSTTWAGRLLFCVVAVVLLHMFYKAGKDSLVERGEESSPPKEMKKYKPPVLGEIHGGILEEEKTGKREISTAEMSGPDRANYLQQACLKLKETNLNRYKAYSRNKARISYSDKHDTLYCPLCKLASTFWTRVFQMLNRNTDHRTVVKTPFDIPISQAPPSKQYISLDSFQVLPDEVDASSAFKFLFVRSPYAFLFSAYVDKLLTPNLPFWRAYGEKAVLRSRGTKSEICGGDATFEEFVDYSLVFILAKGRPADCHTAKFVACSPCNLNYTYVAQMETFTTDTFNILTHLNQTDTLDIFKTQFHDLHAADAIEDTLGPFDSKKEITECIPWPQALRRMWRKLQLRGIIGPIKFPITDEQAMSINKTAFIELAKHAQKISTLSEKKMVKKEAFNEAYSTLSAGILNNLLKAYKEEMFLFGYKPMDLITTRNLAQHNIYKNYFDYDKDLEYS